MFGMVRVAAFAVCVVSMPAQAQEAEPGRVALGVTPGRVALPPKPPAGAAANLKLPTHNADGTYETPNHAISPAQAAWHLRSALNVAALGCRDAHEAETVAGYNQLLRTRTAVLAAADVAVRSDYQARFGAGWQDRHDAVMTRVYNFFAQPPAQAEFCAEAQAVLAEVLSAPEDRFVADAPAKLARLEAPFTAFYDAYGDYQVALARYQAGNSPRVVMATAVAASFGPQP